MPICERRKLAFCHIPRTGGVSICNGLNLKVKDKHFPASYYRNTHPDYTLFSVIRPYEDRIRSAFGWSMDKIPDIIRQKGSENVGLMLRSNEYFLDCEVDFLIRFNHLEEDLNAMLTKLGHESVKLNPCNSFLTMNIKNAFYNAEKLRSKIPEDYIGKLNGLSSPKIWHLLNNLCSDADTYLEIGTYMGSSLLAATYGNNIKATAVDNFCMKPKTRNHFFQNVKKLNNLTFIEKDCFEIEPNTLPKFDIYFFDGRHEFEDQYKALTHFIGCMKDEFIYIVDDWNNHPVKEGTRKAIEDLKLNVVEFEERTGNYLKDKDGWWCGIAVFKFQKP